MAGGRKVRLRGLGDLTPSPSLGAVRRSRAELGFTSGNAPLAAPLLTGEGWPQGGVRSYASLLSAVSLAPATPAGWAAKARARISAISSTAKWSCASTALMPSSNIVMQKGQAAAIASAPVSSASCTRVLL